MIQIIVEDTRELAPPEPLERATSALSQLPLNSILCLRHRKEPCLLYPILKSQSFDHHVVKKSENEFEIFIWRASHIGAHDYLKKINYQANPS